MDNSCTTLAIRSPVIEAAVANKACLSLTRNAALKLNIEGDQTKFLLRHHPLWNVSRTCNSDRSDNGLWTFPWYLCLGDHFGEPGTFPFDIKSFILSFFWSETICCLALREIDDQLYSQIMRLPSLPTDSFFLETYEAALKATIVLIRTYVFIRLHTLEIFFSRFPVFGLGADAVYPGDLYLQHWTAIMTGRALLMLGYHPWLTNVIQEVRVLCQLRHRHTSIVFSNQHYLHFNYDIPYLLLQRYACR